MSSIPYNLFLLSVFLIVMGCGESDIQLKPGPILKDVIQSHVKDKKQTKSFRDQVSKKQETHDQQIVDVHGKVDKVGKQIDQVDSGIQEMKPTIEKEKLHQTKQDSWHDFVSSCEHNVQDFLPAPEDKTGQVHFSNLKMAFPYPKIDKEGKEISVYFFSADLFRLQDLQNFIKSNVKELSIDKSSTEVDLKLEETGVNLPKGTPIVFRTKLFELEANESLQTYGQDIIILSDDIHINGTMKTTPKKALDMQVGQNGGDILLAGINIQFGPNAELDVRGGDAGNCLAPQIPHVTQEQLEQIRAQIHGASVKTNASSSGSKPLKEDEISQRAWSKIKDKVRRDLGNSVANQNPFKTLNNHERHDDYWSGMETQRTDEEVPKGNPMIYKIPRVNYSCRLAGGNGGKIEIISPQRVVSWPRPVLMPGHEDSLLAYQQAAFQIDPKQATISLESQTNWRVTFKYNKAKFRTQKYFHPSKYFDGGFDTELDHYEEVFLSTVEVQEPSRFKKISFQTVVGDSNLSKSYQISPPGPTNPKDGSILAEDQNPEFFSLLEELLFSGKTVVKNDRRQLSFFPDSFFMGIQLVGEVGNTSLHNLNDK